MSLLECCKIRWKQETRPTVMVVKTTWGTDVKVNYNSHYFASYITLLSCYFHQPIHLNFSMFFFCFGFARVTLVSQLMGNFKAPAGKVLSIRNKWSNLNFSSGCSGVWWTLYPGNVSLIILSLDWGWRNRMLAVSCGFTFMWPKANKQTNKQNPH